MAKLLFIEEERKRQAQLMRLPPEVRVAGKEEEAEAEAVEVHCLLMGMVTRKNTMASSKVKSSKEHTA